MASPMQLPPERSTVHVAPRPPLSCDVYVSRGTAPEGWYEAELLEWISFPSRGWTARARYRTGPTGGYVGHFSLDNIRRVNPPS